jgi:DNA-binding transcriptional regulator YiaG
MSKNGITDFGTLARRWRKKHKLSRAEASRKLSIPYRTIEDWEAGRRTPRGFALDTLTKKFSR